MLAFKILIVDDESLSRQRIERYLRQLQVPAQIFMAENGIAACELISKVNPDLLFLDIQMPGMSGFEVLQNLESRTFQVIFQTAFDGFAVQAFDENACDYLLKPFSFARFEKALSKAFNQKIQGEALDRLNITLKSKNVFLEKLIIKSGDKTAIILVNEIQYFTSQDHYTIVGTKDREHITELSLNWLESQLNPKMFFRSHRSAIIAIDQVQSLNEFGETTIEMKSGKCFPLSRRNKREFFELIRV